MSRGPGKIERAIRALFDAHPDEAFVTDELVEHCYPDVIGKIERKHQVAVLRAARQVIADDRDWDAWRINGMGRGWVFVNRDSARSIAFASSIAVQGSFYRSPKRARRTGGDWRRVPGGRMKFDTEKNEVLDRATLLAIKPSQGEIDDAIWHRA